MVGHLGAVSLAGLSLASTILTTTVGLFVFLAYATTATTARLFGAGRRTHTSEVYVATVGGMKVGEPATDLAIAMAMVSAITKKPLPAKTVVLGEVGLAGEIRRVPNVQRRLMEAKRLGGRGGVFVYRISYCPFI